MKKTFQKIFTTPMGTHEIGLKDLVEGLLLLGKMPDIHLSMMSIEKDTTTQYYALSRNRNCATRIEAGGNRIGQTGFNTSTAQTNYFLILSR